MSDPSSPASPTLAELVTAADGGDRHAAGELFTSLYRELRRLAARQLRLGAPGSTLGATTLLHECYLDMSGRGTTFPDRPRFLVYAARAMRGLIVDHIRERTAKKRGGEFIFTTLDTASADSTPAGVDMAQLSDALDALDEADPQLAALVDLKFFCGFAFTEIAAMRGVSERTVQRDWQKARIYLHRTLREAAATG